jgi:tRNA G18 (ribose-2'-O)-methylase SpoU
VTPPKVRISKEDAEKIATAVVLLNKRDQLKDKHGPKDLLKKARVEFDLAQMSEYIISRAEARRRGENRPSLTEARDKRRDPGSVSQEWALVVQEFDDQKVKWAEPALKSEARLQSAIFVFNDALSPLIEALKAAKSSNIPLVEGKAEAATEKLSTAQGTLDPLSKALDRSREQLEGFIATVDKVLKPKPPETLDEVRGTRTTLDGEVQGLRAAQQAVKDQVAAINNLAKKEQKNLEQLVKEMVAAAVAWRQTEKVRQGSDVAASLLNGAVNAAQALDSEPMSALALQGLHSLIKGVCDGINVAAGGIKAAMLKSAYDDVMGLVDKLEADDFIQAKLDLIKLGLSWVAEPLGLIPNVGAIVRTAVNVGVAAVLGTLKKAAAKQAKAAKAARGGTVEVDLTAEVDEAVDVIRESALSYASTMLESFVKVASNPEEETAAFLLELLTGVLGPPLEAVIAKVVPQFGLVDKEQVKQTVQGTRDAVAAQAEVLKSMANIKLLGFDEEAAKKLTILNLEKLDEGDSCKVIVAGAPQLEGTRGVALLVGDGHSDDNVAFATALVKTEQAYQGMVLMKSKGGGPFAGELVFSFSSGKAKEMVKSYTDHYGSGSDRITRKKLTFAP